MSGYSPTAVSPKTPDGSHPVSLERRACRFIRKRLTKSGQNALKTTSGAASSEKILSEGANNAVLRVQTQSAVTQRVIPFCRNPCNFSTLKKRFSGLKCHEFRCRKGLAGLRRGRCCRATAAPLQGRKGFAATPQGPYGKTEAPASSSGRFSAVLKRDFHLSPFFA